MRFVTGPEVVVAVEGELVDVENAKSFPPRKSLVVSIKNAVAEVGCEWTCGGDGESERKS